MRIRLVSAVIGLALLTSAVPSAFAVGVAYVYDDDLAARDAFDALLSSEGFSVTTVPMSQADAFPFTSVDVIVIGRDTGYQYNWGTPAAVANIAGSGRSVVGVYEGGTAYFHQHDMFTGSWHCAYDFGTDLEARYQSHELWHRPHDIPIAGDDTVTMYSAAASALTVWMNDAPPEVTCYGRYNQSHCALTVHLVSGRFTALWSYEGLPAEMTDAGRDLFANLVWLAWSWQHADGFESGDTSAWPAAVP